MGKCSRRLRLQGRGRGEIQHWEEEGGGGRAAPAFHTTCGPWQGGGETSAGLTQIAVYVQNLFTKTPSKS